MRVAIYGGSFDPPHRGHEALVRAALDQLALERLLVVPAAHPVHRTLSGCADGATRLAWLKRLFLDDPRIEVVDWELDAPMPTLHTLQRFARDFPVEVPLLLLGADAAASLERWIGYPQHQQLCNLALFSRAGQRPDPPAGWQPVTVEAWQRNAHSEAGHVVVLEAALPPVSASKVRLAARARQSLADLVPDCIVRDIERHYNIA